MSQVARREDLAVPFEKYQSNGQEKTAWRSIGEIITFKRDDGTYSKMMKLWTMPGITISIFERKAKEEQKPQATRPVATAPQAEEEINVDDIPF